MSNLIVPNDAKQKQLQRLVNVNGNLPTYIRLYQNDYTPGPPTMPIDFIQATFSGYAQHGLSAVAVTWDPATLRAVATWGQLTWTKNGPTGNVIYGYFVLDNADALWWAERFDAPIPMTADGAFITLTPKLTLKSQFGDP